MPAANLMSPGSSPLDREVRLLEEAVPRKTVDLPRLGSSFQGPWHLGAVWDGITGWSWPSQLA